MRDPADGTRQGEENGEHRRREAHRLECDTRIEVDVRIELLLDEILVVEGDPLEFQRDIQHRIVLDPEDLQHFVAGLLHDPCAWVVILVDAMPEAHQTEGIILVLRLLDVFRNAIDRTDFLQHVERSLVGATMRRPPEAGNAGCNAGERICTRGACETNRRGRGVLFVIGMQNEDAVHCARKDGIDLVGFGRNREAHMEEILGIIEIVARIDDRLSSRVLVGHRSDGRHLGNQTAARNHALQRIVNVGRVVIEGRQGSNHTAHDGHRMGITTEATQEEGHLLMHHGVHGDSAFELSVLLCIRKLAIQQQVTGLDEIAMIGQLVDRVAAIQQNAFLAIDIGDVGLAACCRGETRIVGEVTALAIER